MAQNTNYKGTKNNNQKKKLPYIKVRIDKLVDVDDCNTKAFASVTVGGAVAIHGIRVMDSHKGLFVTMPSNNFVDKNGEKQYSEIAHPTSKEARKAISNRVMGAYNQALDEQQSEVESEDENKEEAEHFIQSL